MGREEYLEKIRKRGNLLTVLGLVLLVGGLLIIVVSIAANWSPGFAVFSFFAVILGIIFLIGSGQYRHGENAKRVRMWDNILDLADDLRNNPVYEDDYIIVSEKAICAKKDILKLAAREDVLGVYENITKARFVTTDHNVNLLIRDGRQFQINVYAKKKNVVEDLILNIAHYCPNCKVGYSPDTLRYVSQERKAYRAKRKAQNK